MLALFLTVSEIKPVFHWTTHIFLPSPFNPKYEKFFCTASAKFCTRRAAKKDWLLV